MTNYRVLDEIPEWRRECRGWPDIDASTLSAEQRQGFKANKAAVQSLLAGSSYTQIFDETGLQEKEVRRLLKKCLKDDQCGDILGFRALVPYARTVKYRRSKRIERNARDGRGGCAGALTNLFEQFPDIEQKLTDEILKQLRPTEKIPEPRIEITKLHKLFLNWCRELGLQEKGQWPFNTKTWGATSIRGHVSRIRDNKPERFIAARHGETAHIKTRLGRGFDRFLDAQQPFDIVGLDELKFDAITTIVLPAPGGGEQHIAIERICIVVVIERVSGAFLSWHAFFLNSVSVPEMRTAIQKALTPWEPRKFTIPGLSYGSPDAGMPNGIVDGLAYNGWAILTVDNALAHQDLSLLADLGSRVGCTTNLGPVKTWYRRDDVERRIQELLRNSAHRLPSTTGSNPKDIRKSDPVGTAIKYGIRWTEVSQLIDVIVAQLNATPTERLGFLSPNAFLQQKVLRGSPMGMPSTGFLRRPLPKGLHHPRCITTETIRRRVKGSFEKGVRPYVYLDRASYTNGHLSKAWNLIGAFLECDVDIDDYRALSASVAGTGQVIGVLKVRGNWANTQHTKEMRKAINRLKHRGELIISPGDDPVDIYLRHVARQAAKQSRSKSGKPKLSKAATQLASVQERTNVEIPAPIVLSAKLNELLTQRRSAPQDNSLPSLRELRAAKEQSGGDRK